MGFCSSQAGGGGMVQDLSGTTAIEVYLFGASF